MSDTSDTSDIRDIRDTSESRATKDTNNTSNNSTKTCLKYVKYTKYMNSVNSDHESIDDLIVNLKSISSAQVNEKICITSDGKYLVRDYRYFQCVLRYITGDSRLALVAFIETLLKRLIDTLTDPRLERWRKDKIVQLLPLTLVGLENMKATYFSDRIVLFHFENLIDVLQHLMSTLSTSTQFTNDT